MRRTRFYKTWCGIVARCKNRNEPAYKNYGGRGVRCEWERFEDFRDDMHESYIAHSLEHGEKRTTLDRINNDGNYSVGNCRWVTRTVQARNKRNNHLLAFRGEKKPVSEWAEVIGISQKTLVTRIQNGWSVEAALSVVPKKGRNQFSGHIIS